MINIETPTYYTATKKYELSFPSLEIDLDADVVVIGGGFSGINTALELAEHGITDIVVLEARHLGFGGTGRNGGQIMAGIGHDLEKIRKDVGEDGLRAIFEISDLGADIIKGRIEKYAIDADFCHGYGYMGFNARQAKTLQAWEKEFRSLGSPHEIRYLHGAEVRQIIGSDAYGSALLHMGGGHVHSLNLLLGEAKALAGLGARIFEYSPALEVQYGERIRVRTAKGSVTANKLLWACDSFLNRLEPELHRTTINTYAFQMMTEPLPDELIQRISPIRGAYSDIRPVIDYYRVTNENRLLFGAATPFVERIPGDLKAWNRKLMLKIFPYLEHVRIDLAWGGPMACSANLFPQIGSLSGRPNAFFVQGYSGFGVTPSHIVCKVLAEGMSEGSARYDLLSSVRRIPIHGKDHFRPLLLSAGKTWHQLSGYWNGRR
ncbi:NAD(P)/FAD-dependent oxidoreductase [Pseudomonas aeruginosa]|uniref:NAD(P)/FAD-dependent oxidoreductase n=1 Tax=Pseudomonas aeruginosa TaxID=287 RepID=UPI0032E45840